MNTTQEKTGVDSEFMPEFPLTVGNSPFNVVLMDMQKKNVSFLRPVRVLDMFDGATRNFHSEGFWSVEIFGRVGSKERMRTFSYIDLHTTILHPYVWLALKTLRSLYVEILAGKRHAIWNTETKNFDPASELDGETGFNFFMSHWAELEIPPSKSDNRNTYIESINNYKTTGSVVTRLPVAPAGLRDVEIGDDDRVTKDEVNDLYYRVLAISNTIVPDVELSNPRILDTSRNSLQNAVNEIWLHYEGMCRGKHGMFQHHWGGRAIFNGTRNVITAMDTSTADLDSPRTPGPMSIQIGLYQLLKGALPVAKYHLRAGWLSEVFVEGNAGALLVDPKTLKRKLVDISVAEMDHWTTDEGLDSVIREFSEVGLRQKPVMVSGHYVGLIYIDDDSFKIFGDISELPSHLDPKKVTPLTYAQLLYLSGYRRWNHLVCMLTRYPVIGLGSTYTGWVYCRTTNVASQKWERDFTWEIDKTEESALEFPVMDLDAAFVDSLIPHTIAIKGLDGDFDGDTASANILYGDLSLKENEEYFHTANAYLGPNGDFSITPDVHTVNLVLRNMTGFQ